MILIKKAAFKFFDSLAIIKNHITIILNLFFTNL